IIIEAALADSDDARMVSGFDQGRGAKVRMRVGFVGMHADACPDIAMALGDGNDVIPFALPGRDVEEPADAANPRIFKHFVLAFGEAVVIQMAVTVDQLHAAASSSTPSSSRGNRGCGCAIGTPPCP